MYGNNLQRNLDVVHLTNSNRKPAATYVCNTRSCNTV